MRFASCKSRVYIQPVLLSTMTPFANCVHAIFRSPILTNSCQPWVVIFPDDIWATRGGLDICLTAEVLDYSFTAAVGSSGNVERTCIFFKAVESQLGERQVCSQLIHGGFCKNHLITGYSTVWSLDWQLRGRSWTFHRDVGNKKPASWKKNVKIKRYFIKVLHSVKSIRMAVLIAKLDVRASIYPRKFGSHVTVPPSAQQGNQY